MLLDRASYSMIAPPKAIHLRSLGPELFRLLVCPPGLLRQMSSGGVSLSRNLQLSLNTLYLLSPQLFFFIVFNHELFVNLDDSLTS